MLQRALMTVLVDGVREMLAEPEILREYFEQAHCLTEDEVNRIATLFAAKPPRVALGYVRGQDLEPPQFSVVLNSESDTDRFLGDDAGVVDGVALEGRGWAHRYQVLVYAQNPNACAWYYELAKLYVQRGRRFLTEAGVWDFGLSGAELNPQTAFLPAGVFGRQLTVAMNRIAVTAKARQPDSFATRVTTSVWIPGQD